jgi:uncharacterized OB-fold protein
MTKCENCGSDDVYNPSLCLRDLIKCNSCGHQFMPSSKDWSNLRDEFLLKS